MFCMYCGKQLPDNAKRCSFCFKDEEETEPLDIPPIMPSDTETLKAAHRMSSIDFGKEVYGKK